MALIKTDKEIEILHEGGRILWRVLQAVAGTAKKGISTWDLDKLAREEIKKTDAEPAFPGYKIGKSIPAYPAVLCTSINDEIVHGIPDKKRILKSGDIIGLDLGIKYKGLYTDAAVTVAVGEISANAKRLVSAAKLALEKGIEQVRPGNTLGDVGAAIEAVARKEKLGVIRDLVGHGVGHAIHEPPNVPNYGKPGTLEKLVPGMVIAIEPMFTLGGHEIALLDDGWTMVTADGSLAAHFEKTVAVTESGCLVVTMV